MNPLNYAVARWLVRVPNISLVNLIAERRVVPEFIQDELRPQVVADALLPLLDPASAERRTMVADLDGVRASLGQPGASDRVAAMAIALASGS
jgi:lipid-A-disaccharide synthase